ncbi:MAG: GntR family transcriptional regulator, partial [Burkholderiaceae bacterium]
MRSLSAKPDLTAQVQQAIIDAIASGEFIAGERLTQEELADKLGVSRQPVLQALVLLRDQGLIVDAPNKRGLLVAPLDRKFIEDLYGLRSALDGAAGAAAARQHSKVDINRGEKLLRQGREAVNSRNLKALVQADYAF